MRKIISVVAFGIALLAPVAMPAFQEHNRNDKQASQTKRYYDKQNKDWHDWNDGENQAYQRYTQENHRQNRDFNQLPKKEQQNYFQWRHQHSDAQPSDNRR